MAFDMPTLYGYDTDAPQAAGEFGKCGVAVSSLADMELLFDQIPLDQITTSMTINSPASIIWAMYIAMAEKRGTPLNKLGGTIQNDILKEYTAQNEYIFPPEPSMRLVVDTVEFATSHLPLWNPISISGYHIREAGATAVQELAFTLEDGFEYVRWCLERGLDIDEFAPRLSFFFNIDNYFFEEIAKLRAARRIWAREIRETFHAKNPRSWWMRTHAQTAGWTLTAQQPENNVVRVALQALAAVLGGTQSLHTNSMDEAWALPSRASSPPGTAHSADHCPRDWSHRHGGPVGWQLFPGGPDQPDRGKRHRLLPSHRRYGEGVIPAIETGYLQREIAEAAYRYQKEVDTKEQITVGVNEYATEAAPDIHLLRVDEEGAALHVRRLNQVRRERDNREVRERLRALEQARKRLAEPNATFAGSRQSLRDPW